MPSKVYFTDFHTSFEENILDKFDRLLRRAGLADIDFDRRFAAIKMHFGEYGNLAYLRPNYAKCVADIVREKGGRPFLTDCNTLYVGSRKNALEHLDNAYLNGFTPMTTGCHVIIADGLRGRDEVLVPVPGGRYVKTAKIGAAISEADVLISLSHFKGHENTGFGGALKNLGMGCGSRAGKMEMHCDGKPHVLAEECIGCGSCQRVCAHGAAVVRNGKSSIDPAKCVGCGRCLGACPADAVREGAGDTDELLQKKIAEYALAAVHGKPSFHIDIVADVSPNCDCHSENDVPIIPDVGIFASADPVALDRAAADACNRQAPLPGGAAWGKAGDVFVAARATTDWHIGLDYAESIGLGTQEYELITL